MTTLLGQARSGVGLSGVNIGGSGAAAGEHDVAGVRVGGRKRCDIVVVHGCEALDIELLQSGKFGLGPAEAVSVFVDLVPQVRRFEVGLGQALGFVSGLWFQPCGTDGSCSSPRFQASCVGDALPISWGINFVFLRMYVLVRLVTKTPCRRVLNCCANGTLTAGLR